jgi:Tol biopolymer transport system component
MHRSTTLTTAAALAALALPATAAAAPSGTIAFHQKDAQDEYSQIYAAAADGSTGAVRLTAPDSAPDPAACWGGNCGAEAPEWAADGSRLFFDGSWTPFIHVWSMAPDGSDARQETFSAGFEGSPGVSHDGRLIAYDFGSGEGAPQQGIFVVPRDHSSPPRQLTHGPANGWDTNPELSPDGSEIAFQRFQASFCRRSGCRRHESSAPRSSIWIVATDGSSLRRITGPGRIWSDPHWAPDGSRLLIQSYDERGSLHGISADLFTIRPDGSGLTPITRTRDGEFSFSPDWSPDGEWIAFVHYRFPDANAQIVVMDAAGGAPVPVADCDPALQCDMPTWGPYDGPLVAAGEA